jgi:hypothetical protein
VDGHRFDDLARALGGVTSRRRALAALAAALGGLLLGAPGASAACRARGQTCGGGRGRCCGAMTCCSGRCRRTNADPNHCGPACAECADDQGCRAGACVHHCEDGRLNFDETDEDCGGSCPPCFLFKRCRQDADCRTGVCADGGEGFKQCVECRVDGQCTADPLRPHCVDHHCSVCATDAHCLNPERPHCAGGVCKCTSDADCPRPEAPFCEASSGTCHFCATANGLRDGDESDVDCGGPRCRKCANGQRCRADRDCQSGFCTAAGVCRTRSACDDGLHNGRETDVDCGGPDCPKCRVPQRCVRDGDCRTGHCGMVDLGDGQGFQRRCAECFSDDHCPGRLVCSRPFCVED